ncbi:uncharacterized protein [Clytia hemisphaerica]|uniref:uncharacterized protein n=1 Tax=Clytia hemisphaerica TaxID=252671 RepID=UPI0034D71E43
MAFENYDSFDLLLKIGHQGLPPKFENKNEFLKMVYHKEFWEPRMEAIRQLQQGINIRGLFPIIKENLDEFSKYFTYNKKLDYFYFVEQLKPQFAPEGSNKYMKEDTVYKFFCDYIQNINFSENCTHSLSDVCQFITGSMNIPPMGFQPKIIVSFEHFCNESCNCYPESSTCGYVLKLPVHVNSLEEMTAKVDEAIINGPFMFRG